MPVNFQQLRQLLALVEHGSFVRAAVTLGLSQPALSRSVQAMERSIGARLFDRTHNGVVPTDLGRLYFEQARQIICIVESLEWKRSGDATLQARGLSVGGGPYPAQTILGTALARFVGAYPRVKTRLLIRDWDDLLHKLRSRELDFFVAEVSTLQGEQNLAIEPMATHPLYFAARAGHPLAGRATILAADSFRFPLVSMTRIAPRVLGPMLAAQRRLDDPAAARRSFPAVECNSLSTVKHMVANSDALMVVSLSCIADELDQGQFVVLGSEPWLHLQYGLVRLADRALSPTAATFRDYVLAAEQICSLEEQRLMAKWRPVATPRRRQPAGHRKPQPASRANPG